jgi:hypothetical protein
MPLFSTSARAKDRTEESLHSLVVVAIEKLLTELFPLKAEIILFSIVQFSSLVTTWLCRSHSMKVFFAPWATKEHSWKVTSRPALSRVARARQWASLKPKAMNSRSSSDGLASRNCERVEGPEQKKELDQFSNLSFTQLLVLIACQKMLDTSAGRQKR